MISPRIFALGLIVIAGASVSACQKNASDSENGSFAGGLFSDRSGQPEDRFGEGFGKAFRADPNSEPAKVDKKDVKPVSFTDEPIDVP